MHPKRIYALFHLVIVLSLMAMAVWGFEVFLRYIYDKEAVIIPCIKIFFTGSPE